MVREFRIGGIAPRLAHRAIHAVDRQERQRVRADDLAHFPEIVGRGQQAATVRQVDAVVVGMDDRRRRQPEVDLAGPGVTDHAHDLLRSGAAHQRIVDQDDALAFDRGAVRIVLHAHAEFAHALGRLNEGAADIVIADDAEFERYAGMLAVADRGGDAGIRHRHHDIDLDMAFAGELRAEGLADLVHRAPADDRVGPREVDVFENARTRRLRRKRLVALRAAFVEYDDFAGIDVADVFRADDIEGAGFGGEYRAAVEFAHQQRANAERIARADQFLVGHRHQRVGALDRAQRLDETVDETVAFRLRDQVQDHLGVGGGLHHGAVAHQLAPQGQPVGEIAVVANREPAGIELGEQRLYVAQDGRAGGGIAGVADGGVAGEAINHLPAGEGVADQPDPPFAVKPGAVKGDDAGSFLAPMLQCLQSEGGDGGGFRMTEDAEDPAFLPQCVAVQVRIEVRVVLRGGVGRALLAVHRASLLAWYQRAAGFSISFLRLSRAGLL